MLAQLRDRPGLVIAILNYEYHGSQETGMDIAVCLVDLTKMHPRLLWEDICAAAILCDVDIEPPFSREAGVSGVVFGGALCQWLNR